MDHEHVGPTDGFIDGDEALAVGKAAALHVPQGQAELLANGLGQGAVGIAAEDFQILAM